MERVRAQVSPQQFRRAMYQATFRTTRTMTARLKDRTRERLNITATAANDAITSKVVGGGEQSVGVISVTRKRLGLIDFRHTVRKGGVSAVIEKGRAPVEFRHGFKATMRSGHVGIFLRKRLSILSAATQPQELMEAHGKTLSEAETSLGILKSRFGKLGINNRSGRPYVRVTPRGFAWRLPLQELGGPPVISTIEDVTDQEDFASDIRIVWRKNMLSQLSRFTKK